MSEQSLTPQVSSQPESLAADDLSVVTQMLKDNPLKGDSVSSHDKDITSESITEIMEKVVPKEGKKSETQEEIVEEVLEQSNDNKEVVEEAPVEKASVKLAALAREEKRLRQSEAKITQQARQVQQQLQYLEQQQQEFNQLQNNLRKDPLAFLEANGISYEQLARKALFQEEIPEVEKTPEQIMDEKVEAKIAKLREEMELQSLTRERAAVEQALMANISRELNQFELLSSQPEASQTVRELMEGYYDSTGKILDVSEACQMIESHLEEEAEKLFNSNKFKSKFSRIEEPKTVAKSTAKTPTKTLSNNLAKASTPNKEANPFDGLESDEDIIARATKLFLQGR
jgi:hypothetical protein